MKRVCTIFVFLLFVLNGQAQNVVIGAQKWKSKNLDVAFYRNGDAIPQVTDDAEWAALTTGAWCYYNNDSTLGKKYGKLYNWYAVNDPRGLAPRGWHIPSDAEWTTLETTLGGSSAAGWKMIEPGTLNWTTPNTGAVKSSGWADLPGGIRSFNGSFNGVAKSGYWWSVTESDAANAWFRSLNSYLGGVLIRLSDNKNVGVSVRCLRN